MISADSTLERASGLPLRAAHRANLEIGIQPNGLPPSEARISSVTRVSRPFLPQICTEARLPGTQLIPIHQYISPLRYPGGKSWLTQRFERWLGNPVAKLVEPFAGGGSISLHALSSNLVDNVLMCELDPNVAALWKATLGSNVEHLIQRILAFTPTLENLRGECHAPAYSIDDLAWQTLLRNRFSFGGILASHASFMKRGERNKGLASRWYPTTLAARISCNAINASCYPRR
jgi:DNA adenine methylase